MSHKDQDSIRNISGLHNCEGITSYVFVIRNLQMFQQMYTKRWVTNIDH